MPPGFSDVPQAAKKQPFSSPGEKFPIGSLPVETENVCGSDLKPFGIHRLPSRDPAICKATVYQLARQGIHYLDDGDGDAQAGIANI